MRLTGRILTPAGWVDGALEADARVTAVRAGAGGKALLIPGFVDLHVHGGGGADVLDGPEGVARVGAFHVRHGTTSLCPTTVTQPLDALEACLRGLAEAEAPLRLLGAHLEGPFLAPARRGAQPDHCLEPNVEALTRLLDAGRVDVVTLAPERPGALDLIRLLKQRGVRVSLGHSNATLAQAREAFAAGADGVTHLFNAMSGMHHREPGLAAAALEAEGAYLELILDRIHVHPALFALARRAARGRLLLVSDAIRAAGAPEGESELGGQRVTVCRGRATLDDGTLAGSVLTLDQAFRNAIDCGLAPEEASALLSRHPADALGREDLGRLAADAHADVLELDPDDLRLRRVFVGGVEVDLA